MLLALMRMNRRTFLATAAAFPGACAGCAHRPSRTGSWTPLASLPDALGVAAPFAGVSGDSLLVAGGANFPNGFPWEGGRKVWHEGVYRLASPEGQWTRVGQLPRPLAYGVSVSGLDGVLCLGGSDSTRHHADTFRLFLDGEIFQVETLPPLPRPLAQAAGARVGRHLLLCGGSTEPGEQSALNQLWALDLSQPSAGWHEWASLPAAPRFLSIAAANGNEFYLFGGVGLSRSGRTFNRVYLSDAWRYRIASGWQRLPDLPRPLAASPSPAPVIGNEILLLPGDDGSRSGIPPAATHPGFARRTLLYDLRRQTWRDGGEVPFAHVTTPCVQWRQRLVVPSGEVRPGMRSPEVWSFVLHDGVARDGQAEDS